MAKILAGVGCSYSHRQLAFAMDTGITDDDYWKPVFEGSQKSSG